MFSGTVFVQQREPDSDLQLPRSCWAVYERLDGETPIGQIAKALDLSEAETFAVVRQLQQWNLIEEPTLSYSAYQGHEPEASTEDVDGEGVAEDETTEGETTEDEESVSGMAGDGTGSPAMNGAASTATEEEVEEASEAIHLPTLWDWLEEETDNVKSYKNTQAFVLMEASDALESIGVGNMEDLEEIERCSDPEVIEALEKAIENNVNERIPEQCYR